MSVPDGSGSTGRGRLTRDRILAAAVAYADQNGIDALSMRKLAGELGFEVMSLYNHVENKGDILSGAVDLVMAEVELPEADLDWRAAIHHLVGQGHRALVRHPWVTSLWFTTDAGQARLTYMETLLGIFRRAGFSVELTHHGFHAVNRHLLGFTAEEVNVRIEGDDLKAAVAGFVERIGFGEFPHMIEHAQHHVDHPTGDRDFEFGLDLLLGGLERVNGTDST